MEAFKLQVNVTIDLKRPAAPSQDPTPSLSNRRWTPGDGMLIDLEEESRWGLASVLLPLCCCPSISRRVSVNAIFWCLA